MNTTGVFSRILANRGARTQILQGGTSSSKTYSILQYFYIQASNLSNPHIFSIVSESLPHLRRGALRDWMAILGEDYDPDAHNKTDETFQINKSIVEFFSVDHPDKARGGRRDFLFINEANRIPKDTRDQLEVRTRLKEFIDFNPTSRFWAHDLQGSQGVTFDISTYRDNQYLTHEIIKSIESRRDTNPNWWRVYGEGQIGRLEGLIIPDFELIEKLPLHLQTTCGMDFGYTNDPSVLLESGEQSDCLFINQLFYKRGMTNPDIVSEMARLSVPRDYIIYADCAEPKSIAEIFNHGQGFKGIRPCSKGPDCFRLGVDHIHRYKKIFVTKNSIDIIKDFRNAMWEQTITGEYLNKAKRGYLHSIDALIYSLNDKFEIRRGSGGGNIAI
jgi:phage terminase large subunit